MSWWTINELEEEAISVMEANASERLAGFAEYTRAVLNEGSPRSSRRRMAEAALAFLVEAHLATVEADKLRSRLAKVEATTGPKKRKPHRHICECGKRGYPSPAAARRAMKTAANKVRVYQCDQGPWFHVTSRPNE